ncbi:hypothetical protein N9R79_01385 [Vibrio sp.]|nr:hypothetical protein [Vibrio sp.]
MINTQNLLDMFDNDKEIIKPIFQMYLEENRMVYEEIQSAFTESDDKKLYSVCHRIYGALVNLNEEDISPLIKEVEIRAAENAPSDKVDIEKIIAELKAINEQVETFILS